MHCPLHHVAEIEDAKVYNFNQRLEIFLSFVALLVRFAVPPPSVMKTFHLLHTITVFVLAQTLLVTATPIALSPATGPHVVARGLQESSVQTQQHIDPMNGALLEARVSQDEPLADKWKYCREAALPPSLSKVFLSRRGSLQLVTTNGGDEILVYLPLTTDSKATDGFRKLIQTLRAAFMTQPNKKALGMWLIHQQEINEYRIPHRPYRETPDKPEEERIRDAIQALHDYQGKFVALSQFQHKWVYGREAGLWRSLSDILLPKRSSVNLLTRNGLVVIHLPLETDSAAVAAFKDLVEKLRRVFRHHPYRKGFSSWLAHTRAISQFGIPPRNPGGYTDEPDVNTINEGIQAVHDYQQKFVQLAQSVGDTRQNAS
ncbi:hypothetical protein H0H93_006905 [Arthromyces matolae]|nr:hypothetical protein H0H93_006905 [Arthromyces matolae]